MLVPLMMLSSCVAEEPWEQGIQTGTYTYIFEGSNISETKVNFGDKADGIWPLLWEKGDVIGVFKADGTFVGSASINGSDAGKNSARFTVSSNVRLSQGEPLHFVYPYSSEVKFSDGIITTSLSPEWTQKASVSSAGIGQRSIAHAQSTYDEENTSFTLSYSNASLRVSLVPGEFSGYDLHGLTLWCKGAVLSGKVALDVADGTYKVSEPIDYVRTDFSQPIKMESGKTYSFWLSSLPADFTGKELYAIVHMKGTDETVTLPIHLTTAGKLPKQTVTSVTLSTLAKSLSPKWYEPVEKRYIAAYGKGWAYGPQNTVLFTTSGATKDVEFKARGNFMKVVEPKYIQVVYSSSIAEKTSGIVYIGGSDSYSGEAHRVVALGDGCLASIKMKTYYSNSSVGIANGDVGHLAALNVMDKDKNVIWGTNLWLAVKPFNEIQYTNGRVLDRNIGGDGAVTEVKHWICNGCYFQWGRPWAFPWTKTITGKRKYIVDQTNTLEKSAANPYYFMCHAGEPYDWYFGDGNTSDRSDDLDDLWGNPNTSSFETASSSGMKSIYDPCPEGYMVVSPSILAEVENNIATKVGTVNSLKYVLHNGAYWPFAGSYKGDDHNVYAADIEVGYWSNSNYGARGRILSYRPTWDVPLIFDREKTAATPIRCMVEVRDFPSIGGSGSSGSESGGNGGGEIEDDGRPQIPEGFVEEPNDNSSDQVKTFDYSLLANASHPRLMIDDAGFRSLKEKVTTGRLTHPTLAKLHDEVVARAGRTVNSNREFKTTDDHYMIVDNLVTCAYAYRMTGNSKYLTKARKDLESVCAFSDWDYASLAHGEISLGVAIAYDWLYYDLTLEERKMVRQALSTKSVAKVLSYDFTKHKGNWNSIKTSGVVCAAIAIYEKDKSNSMAIIEKCLSANKNAAIDIYKGGGYTEGSHYWDYGSSFEICMITALENIFGHSAGLMQVSGLLESGKYATYIHGTANKQFCYSDGGGNTDRPFVASWWFAAKKNDPEMMFAERFHIDQWYKSTPMSGNNGDLRYRLLAPMIAMIRDYDIDAAPLTPLADKVFQCGGDAPLVIVRNGWKFDATDTYLGIKGGKANTGHAHMDIGSFVFEAEGERWSDDMMRPGYGDWFQALYDAGGNSGDSHQKAMRWDTYHISNLCHSTIVSYTNNGTVSNKIHSTDYYVDGFASIDQVIESNDRQGAVVNMSAPMKGQVQSAKRTIELVNNTELVVTDEITALAGKDCILEWRMLSLSASAVAANKIILTGNNTKSVRNLTVTSSDAAVIPVLTTWKTECPHGTDNWCKPQFHEEIKDRTLAGWKVTIPKGKTVTFTTRLTR